MPLLLIDFTRFLLILIYILLSEVSYLHSLKQCEVTTCKYTILMINYCNQIIEIDLIHQGNLVG